MCVQVSEGVKPTLAELEKFEEQTESLDIERILVSPSLQQYQ
jgi:hypothetical protein